MALPDFKDIIDLVKKGSTLEAQERIVELREAHLNLREEVLRLREENRLLRDRIAVSTALTFDRYYYWRVIGDGKDGPFCQTCWDGGQKLVRLIPERSSEGWNCTVCNRFIADQSYSSARYSRAETEFDPF
ncbi:hypothetical protein [Hyphomicrobium sp. CS1GBMeth3]|uniref:hypothetical protein n=1 Tax=Hyphomicrobium sp. CS1GBMeth3 TaxID=1892845 RepID=UPI0009307C85|nr:hypothetical protein [Hyphomicrobium sp. CS1GBMeth3]